MTDPIAKALHTARLTYASYYAWDRAVKDDTRHGSSERDRFEANLDALMEDIGLGGEMRALSETDPAALVRAVKE